MVAAQKKRLRYRQPAEQPVYRQPKRRGVSDGAVGWARRVAWPGRVFFVLVVVPVLLMLGSIYIHTVAAGLAAEAARLEEEKTTTEDEGERLEVRLTELSEPGRIRKLAKENLWMEDPGGKNLMTHDGSDGEDVANGGGEKDKRTGE